MQESVSRWLFITGAVLTVAGLMFVISPKSEQSLQAAEPYSSTWQATRILTVDATVGNTPVGEAGIGVWEWRVDGVIGGTTFTETWTAPSINGVSFSAAAGQGCGLNGIVAEELMASCFVDQDNIGGDNTSVYTFRIRSIGEYLGRESRLNVGAGDQKANSCINSPRNGDETECLIQSGSYSFQHIHEPGFPGRTRWLGGGTLMPLNWDVSGSIN
jgi:hypothetical protein